jgi:hypothetical protein
MTATHAIRAAGAVCEAHLRWFPCRMPVAIAGLAVSGEKGRLTLPDGR